MGLLRILCNIDVLVAGMDLATVRGGGGAVAREAGPADGGAGGGLVVAPL